MRRNFKGFTLVEIMIVLSIIVISVAMSFFALQGRSTHYRMRGSIRELMQMMRLAQSAAIKRNLRHRIVFNANSIGYRFEVFTPVGGGWVDATPSSSQKLANTALQLPDKVTFANMNLIGGCNNGVTCQSPRFSADGTLAPAGSFGITDGNETFTMQWTIGGSIRIQ